MLCRPTRFYRYMRLLHESGDMHLVTNEIRQHYIMTTHSSRNAIFLVQQVDDNAFFIVTIAAAAADVLHGRQRMSTSRDLVNTFIVSNVLFVCLSVG